MDIGQIRDWVLIVAGILWTIVFLIVLIITLVVYYFTHKYLGVARDFLHIRVREFLGEVQDRAELVRQQTAALPRYGAPVAPRVTERAQRPLSLRLPFRRRRPWWRKVLR
jgi:hypothetical protein